MRETKKLRKSIDEWIRKNGACDLDIKGEDIQLFNGGLFQNCNENYAELWVGDLDDTIRYLRRLKHFLNKNGFNTRGSASDWFLDKKKRDAIHAKDNKVGEGVA